MTEEQFLACGNPTELLEFLRDKVSPRKFRLFACACCRAIWPFLEEEVSQQAIVIAEDFADGRAGRKELHAARRSAGQFGLYRAGWVAAYIAAGSNGWYAARDVVEHATNATAPPGEAASRAEAVAAHRRFAHLLRDISGNQFCTGMVPPTWQSSNAGIARQLAQAIYDGHTFDLLPVLADALEEVGYTDHNLLSHLRGPGPHARGCWALDYLLDKV